MNATPAPDPTNTILFRGKDPRLSITTDHLRSCRRAIAYAALRCPTSNSVPNGKLTAEGALRALREVTLDAMTRDGWSLTKIRGHQSHPESYSWGYPHKNMLATGQPDAIGYHPNITSEQPVVIITNSGPGHLDNTAATAAMPVHQGSSISPRNQGERLGFIAWIDGSTELNYQAVNPSMMAEEWEHTIEWLRPLSQAIDENGLREIPPKDFRPASEECRQCPWRSACHHTGEEQ